MSVSTLTTDIRVCFNINDVMLGDLLLSKHNKEVKQFIFLCLNQKKYQYLHLSYAVLEIDTRWKNIYQIIRLN